MGAKKAYTYTNRMGDTYYLHEGRTKTGRPRYFFAREPRAGTIAEIPDGFEVAESINGVVSLRRPRQPKHPIPAADLAVVEAELARHARLRFHEARAEDGEIVIHAPLNDAPRLLDTITRYSLGRVDHERVLVESMARSQYSPVMKFVREGDRYVAHRMTFRGDGGWSWPLGSGTIAAMAKRFVAPIGTDAFFELT